MNIQQILLKYWGYNSFRPLQEEIIQSVLDKQDTLALMPTGGGKSICFQVPAMAMDGVCVVITPLISLMKDQVENLRNKGIKAAALHTGMHYHEIDHVLDNCVYGDIKFLYLSPERIVSETFRLRLKKMKVCLLAVDESHCISQWGYDFRPPYLRIAELREHLPGVPVLALTATATPEVVADIQKKLGFPKEHVFIKSFERENLVYAVIQEEDKPGRLLKIAGKVKGTGIIYVRSRKKTREIADFLNKNSISASYYHAGLDTKTRDLRQNEWMKGITRIIVATNAFGMGIDKPDVRFVVHYDIPDTLEAYFQEAGRAGRDEKRSYGLLLFNQADISDAKYNLEASYPTPDMIRNVYQCLGNYYNLAVGSGAEAGFDFDITQFSANYNLKPFQVFAAIKFLERDGYITGGESMNAVSRVFIDSDKETLYRFQVENKHYELLLKTLLRSYGGVLSDFVNISETELANRMNIPREKVIEQLIAVARTGILTYIPQNDKPQIVFASERVDVKQLEITKENYFDRKRIALQKLEAVLHYAGARLKCRSQILLEYFGESNAPRCGQCDVCLERNKLELSELEFDNIIAKLKPLLTVKPLTLDEIVPGISGAAESKVLKAIQWLIDNGKIIIDDDQKLKWNHDEHEEKAG